MIMDACRLLVERLATRQKAHRDSAAIVFVGNDRPNDPIDNQHAEDVKDALKRLDRHLNVVIATSTTSKAAENIADFANGRGDVLVVKQMAGIGLDVDRLKVCLDLSNIRQAGAFIQRLTRIATIWDRRQLTGREEDVITTADYITPDDIMGEGLFNRFVRDQGGQASEFDLNHTATLELNASETQTPKDRDIAKRVTFGEHLYDSHQLEAPGESLGMLEKVKSELPKLDNLYTHPQLWQGLERAGLIQKSGEPEIFDSPLQPSRNSIRNVNEEQEKLRSELNRLAKQLARRRLPYLPSGQEMTVHTRVWTEHKKAVGVHPATKLRDIPDTASLRRLLGSMRRELASYRSDDGTLL